MSLWSRLASPFREFGPRAGALYLLDRGLRAASRGRIGLYVYELMVQPISADALAANGKPLLPARMAARLRWVELQAGDPVVAAMPAREDIKASRFAQGAKCLAVYREDQLLGYLWFGLGRYDEDEVRCRFLLNPPQQSVFDFDLYVMPEHRMGIGFLALWHCANVYLSAQGIRYTFSRLTRFNLASRRAHAHLGWRRVAGAVFLQAWGLEVMVSTCRPWLGLTWSARQKVQLNLEPDALERAQA